MFYEVLVLEAWMQMLLGKQSCSLGFTPSEQSLIH